MSRDGAAASLELSQVEVALGPRPILQDISFSVQAGELCVLLGPNGVGKTTLLRCIDGLVPPRAGQIKVSGKDVVTLGRKELSRHVAYVPQLHQGVFSYPVEDFVLLGRTPYLSWFGSPGPQDRALTKEVLSQLGIDDLAKRDYMRLSGGERQLVLLARGLVQEAGVMLLDEPTAHLDFTNLHRVMESVKELTKSRGFGALVALHDPNLALEYADRIVLLHEKTSVMTLQNNDPQYLSRLEQGLRTVYGNGVSIVSLPSGAIVVRGKDG